MHGHYGGSGAISAGQSGFLKFTGSGTVAITLPTITADTVGLEYELANGRTGIATITVSSNQYYDNIASHVDLTLPAVTGSTVAKCVLRAVDDGSGGNFHWAVLQLYGGAAIV